MEQSLCISTLRMLSKDGRTSPQNWCSPRLAEPLGPARRLKDLHKSLLEGLLLQEQHAATALSLRPEATGRLTHAHAEKALPTERAYVRWRLQAIMLLIW